MQNQQDSGNRHVLSTGPLYLKFDPQALYLSEIWDWTSLESLDSNLEMAARDASGGSGELPEADGRPAA